MELPIKARWTETSQDDQTRKKRERIWLSSDRSACLQFILAAYGDTEALVLTSELVCAISQVHYYTFGRISKAHFPAPPEHPVLAQSPTLHNCYVRRL